MKIAVIIPTYNEVGNIERMIGEVQGVDDRIELFIVDDNSPDGTGTLIEKLTKSNEKLHLIKRKSKEGLGKAYIHGFQEVLSQKKNYNYIIQMDADFSHDPKNIKKMIEKMKTHDLVIGSRYTNGVSVVNWPLSRILLSWFGNAYARIITRIPVTDVTGGFKCFKREVLEAVNWSAIQSDGYCFQVEVNYATHLLGFTLGEIPIIFQDRSIGTSKMTLEIVIEALFQVTKLLFKTKDVYYKTYISNKVNEEAESSSKKTTSSTPKKKSTPSSSKKTTSSTPKKKSTPSSSKKTTSSTPKKKSTPSSSKKTTSSTSKKK